MFYIVQRTYVVIHIARSMTQLFYISYQFFSILIPASVSRLNGRKCNGKGNMSLEMKHVLGTIVTRLSDKR